MGHYKSELNEHILTKLFFDDQYVPLNKPQKKFRKILNFEHACLSFLLDASCPEAVILGLSKVDLLGMEEYTRVRKMEFTEYLVDSSLFLVIYYWNLI